MFPNKALYLQVTTGLLKQFCLGVCNSRTREKAEHIGKRDVSYTASGTALCVENTHCVLQVHLRCKCLTNTLLLYDCILTAVNF